MSNYQNQQQLRQPPSLPIHYDQISPSPTPTVKPQDAYMMDKYGEKQERNGIPKMGGLHDTIEDDRESGGGLVEKKRKKKRMEGRNCCVRCMCCACIPVWATCILWFIIIAIIIVIIVIAAIAGTFVMPTFEMAGITNSPTAGSQITFSGDGLNINFGLIIKVNNPNLLSIDLTNIKATAFYPNPNGGSSEIGGGFLAEKFVPTYSDLNFTFPFAIEYNPNIDTDQSVLSDLAEKCGLTGGPKSDITIDYTIHLSAKVLVIKVNPTISSSATFPCPLDVSAKKKKSIYTWLF
ncbi:hypothetical protein INT47_012330 [Mucor saturninus]|uniref:Late embryogenesis abundant protein LEA-2 subgroup domain-containing protein n=1 Tax=Mucor saturninus TaxID=64648 RepID=A0A8H7V401_9FUNG|nr:hypothetical protein INT47_012330 [Mucor saturninus]